MAFGQRLKVIRTRRGYTREVLGGLVGRSASWVKALECGRLDVPKLVILLRLAEALRVRNLAELTGDQSVEVEMFSGPGHSRLPAVRAALNDLAFSTDRRAPAPEHLRARVVGAWAARHATPYHREVIGAVLPDLLRDSQVSARQVQTPTQFRAAQATLSSVYSLAQFFIAYQPAQDLLWRVVERSLIAAQGSDDPHAMGVAAWLATQAHRDAGDWDAADAVAIQALRHLEPLASDHGDDVLAIWGALHFEAGYTAARRGEKGSAWHSWDRADRIAARLPVGYYHPVTSFSRAIMRAHAVTIAVELRAGAEGTRQASVNNLPIPSRPRLARHRIEQARAYYLDAQPDAAVATLSDAHTAAPETVAYNGYARRIVLEEMDSAQPARRRRAAELAQAIGMISV